MPNRFSQATLITYALQHGILKFGEFTLKSGRVSPYFFNAGLFNDGKGIDLLAAGYASVLADVNQCDVVFGPAYKGIPLAAATASCLWGQHQLNVSWGYNRKEAKNHGEGGVLVGADVAGKRVWIIDDVITAGTAIREVMQLLQQAGAIVAGVVVALDRQERGKGELSAIQEVEQEYEIPVKALITLSDLMDYVHAEGRKEDLERMQAYRHLYGI